MSGLVILSLLNTFGAPIEFKNMVLENYQIFFDDTFIVLQSIENSFILSISTATLCVVLGIAYVWIVERTEIVGRGSVTVIIMITFGFPAVAMGVGVLIGYINWLYGTLWILFVAYMAKKIPFAFIFLRNAIKQIMEELEEAARIAGASWARMVWDITIPLMKTGIWVAWVLDLLDLAARAGHVDPSGAARHGNHGRRGLPVPGRRRGRARGSHLGADRLPKRGDGDHCPQDRRQRRARSGLSRQIGAILGTTRYGLPIGSPSLIEVKAIREKTLGALLPRSGSPVATSFPCFPWTTTAPAGAAPRRPAAALSKCRRVSAGKPYGHRAAAG